MDVYKQLKPGKYQFVYNERPTSIAIACWGVFYSLKEKLIGEAC